ncbi:hypothetical protein [Rubellicoccus peritrichatus]|uniref:Uncharacterized protein n=1 Tax=Rubellicoccus peritrichatus TaxID=3080537 RepID=A0AAQ3LCT5_9BACT|nr:hypothetical protein [Puniceicoccus sp. CR14]WOO43032.1 hypothetical protein RZN69_07995 [Puniceicoccus sp. CR14]
MRFKFSVFAILLVLFFSTAYGKQEGKLLFLGLTDLGWQIFAYDLTEGEPYQLTYSVGDKRSPKIHGGQLYFRDTLGKIKMLSDNGKELDFPVKIGPCFDFAFGPDNTLFYVAHGPQGNLKFWLYRKEMAKDTPSKVFFRPEVGSVSQIAYSENEHAFVTSQILRSREERILWIPVSNPDLTLPISPVGELCFAPSFGNEANMIYCAFEKSSGHYEIARINKQNGVMETVVSMPDASVVAPSVDADGKSVYFEVRSVLSESSIGFQELNSKEVQQIDLPYAAKEPVWISGESLSAYGDLMKGNQ